MPYYILDSLHGRLFATMVSIGLSTYEFAVLVPTGLLICGCNFGWLLPHYLWDLLICGDSFERLTPCYDWYLFYGYMPHYLWGLQCFMMFYRYLVAICVAFMPISFGGFQFYCSKNPAFVDILHLSQFFPRCACRLANCSQYHVCRKQINCWNFLLPSKPNNEFFSAKVWEVKQGVVFKRGNPSKQETDAFLIGTLRTDRLLFVIFSPETLQL